jgi:ABC-type uncharacterized transport system permease subunit
VLSGFLYPTGLLPPVFEALARLLPTAWAMEGVVRATQGSGSDSELALDLLIAGGLICVYLALAALLFRKAEERVRVSGSLAVF